VEDLRQWYWVNGDTLTHKENRYPHQIRQQNPQMDIHGSCAGVGASVSPSVECEYEHIVTIDSVLDFQEHGYDPDGSTIVSNTTELGLYGDIRK